MQLGKDLQRVAPLIDDAVDGALVLVGQEAQRLRISRKIDGDGPRLLQSWRGARNGRKRLRRGTDACDRRRTALESTDQRSNLVKPPSSSASMPPTAKKFFAQAAGAL